MKKRVLFVSHALDLGGAESSLIGYLTALGGRDDVETELFLCRHEGELLSCLPESTALLPEIKQYACLAVPIRDALKRRCLRVAFGRLLGKLNAAAYMKKHRLQREKCGVGLEYSHKYTKAFMPPVSDKEYDLAVSFLTPHYFAAEKVRAKKKIAFVHTDYSYLSVDAASEFEMWAAYERIAAVSEAVGEGFLRLFPSLAERTVVLENIIPEKLVRARAEEFVPAAEMPDDGNVKILSAGRFCDAKNFESIPFKVSLLKKAGLRVRWYIIGFGDDSLIRSAVRETGTGDEVVILGRKSNPYPYIKRCDIYAQPSRYEGKAVTVLEAQMLAKPVLIADYATARSQLRDGFDGLAAPMDDEGFAKALAALIRDRGLQKELSLNCLKGDYGNAKEADKLLDLML